MWILYKNCQHTIKEIFVNAWTSNTQAHGHQQTHWSGVVYCCPLSSIAHTAPTSNWDWPVQGCSGKFGEGQKQFFSSDLCVEIIEWVPKREQIVQQCENTIMHSGRWEIWCPRSERKKKRAFCSMRLGRNDCRSSHQSYFTFLIGILSYFLSLLSSHSLSPLWWLEWVLNGRGVRAQHKPVSRLDGALP